jgi:hypothetical protein
MVPSPTTYYFANLTENPVELLKIILNGKPRIGLLSVLDMARRIYSFIVEPEINCNAFMKCSSKIA